MYATTLLRAKKHLFTSPHPKPNHRKNRGIHFFLIMRKTLSALCIVLATSMTSANAQEATIVAGKIRCSENTELILPQGTKFSIQDFGTKKHLIPVKPRKATTEEELVTVKLKVISAGKPSSGAVFNKDLKEEINFRGKEGTIKVPKGTYDFYVDFISDSYYYVFKENVQVTQDLVLEFDQGEATNPIEFHYFDENSKELFMDIYSGSTLDTPGTADEMTKLTSIIHKEYGNTAIMMSQGYMPKEFPMEFYINKLSDKYFVGQSTTIGVGSHYYVYKAIATEFKPQVINSDPANLQKLVTEFTPSPAMKDNEKAHLPGVETTFLTNGYMLANIRTWCYSSPADQGKVITFIDCPEATEKDEHRMNTTVRPVSTDAYEMVSDGYEEYEEFTFTVAPSAVGNAKEGVKYLVSGSDMDTGFNVPVGETGHKFYPGHPEFSFVSTDGTALFGNSVPMISYRSMKLISDSEVYSSDIFRYMGRYGEVHETDTKLAEVNQKETSAGTEITITNTNIDIDGIAGKNAATIVFDNSKPDKTAPTFQMLTFKDATGNICDRLPNTQDAKMLVAGGDFTYVDNPNPPYIGHFTCDAPSSVKAFYAPHGTDTWTELSLVEDKEKYFMPAFGHFFEADLSGVKADKENAWFDVRLEIADATGNYQKQTLSPGFQTNSTSSGIEQITSGNALITKGNTIMLADGKEATLTVYSIDGRILKSVYANSIDLSNMVSGIYVVKATTEQEKVISTKVAL